MPQECLRPEPSPTVGRQAQAAHASAEDAVTIALGEYVNTVRGSSVHVSGSEAGRSLIVQSCCAASIVDAPHDQESDLIVMNFTSRGVSSEHAHWVTCNMIRRMVRALPA